MPTNYTPVPGNAPATITLPSDADDADAESVNVAFRAIADNLYGEAAIKANPNTFTRGQVIDTTSASEGLIKTNLPSTKDSNPSNAWQPLIESLADDVYVYSGDNPAAALGGFAVTYNAKWVPANNRWEAQNSAHNAYMFSLNYGNIYASAVKSQATGGPANWATWPAFGSPNLVGDMYLGRNMHVGGDVIGSDNGIFSGAVSAPFFDYPSPQPKSTILFPEGGNQSSTLFNILQPGAYAIYRITVPTGATLGEVTVKIRESAACTYGIDLFRIDSIDFSATDVASLPALTTVDTATYGPGVLNAILNWTLDYGGMPVNKTDEVFYIRVQCLGGSPTSIDVCGVKLYWNDPGPRNH